MTEIHTCKPVLFALFNMCPLKCPLVKDINFDYHIFSVWNSHCYRKFLDFVALRYLSFPFVFKITTPKTVK